MAKVVLKKGKTQLFKDGSPMVYSGAVDRIIGRPPPKTGDIVLVADGTEKPIAWGFYNSASMFCVRLMQLQEEASRYLILSAFPNLSIVPSFNIASLIFVSFRDPSCALNIEKLLETRIDAAIKLRKSLGLPSPNTNAYRLVNSEGDRYILYNYLPYPSFPDFTVVSLRSFNKMFVLCLNVRCFS